MANNLIFIKYSHILLAFLFCQYVLLVYSEHYVKYSNVSREMKRTLAKKEGYFTNTWAVEIDDPGEEHVLEIAKRHGFAIIGKVGRPLFCLSANTTYCISQLS